MERGRETEMERETERGMSNDGWHICDPYDGKDTCEMPMLEEIKPVLFGMLFSVENLVKNKFELLLQDLYIVAWELLLFYCKIFNFFIRFSNLPLREFSPYVWVYDLFHKNSYTFN